MCDKPVGDGENVLNTAAGLLDWKTRTTVKVIVPTVYSKVKWARRRLCESELGHVMDYPGDKLETLLPAQVRKLLLSPIPGKLLAIAVASLTLTLEGGTSHSPEA
jgi:hypothetical protein